VGNNHLVYSDASTGERRVRITHRWLERTSWHAPNPPTSAISPPDGATVEGTRVTLAWNESSDPDGDAIVDYHFELSADARMRWPLSPNFEKRISLTPFKGKRAWTVPYVGLLNPDTTYHWRVRAMDATGVWGPWSDTFRFQVRGPGVPLDVRLTPDDHGGLMLTWRPNPQGRTPVAYRVYGSDEKGFSASDTEFLVFRGKGFVRTIDEFADKPADAPDAGQVKTPANIITRVSATRLRVVGPDVQLPNTNTAFYRVVAVDSVGNASGPSDYAEVPRPLVANRPDTPARVGVPYRYQPQVIRSIGDLRCRRSKTSSYNAAFWDREEPTFKAVRLADGLSLEPTTGLIHGTPKVSGDFDIAFEVSLHTGKSVTVVQPLNVTE
jgi:hypothetical protein